MRFTWDPVKSAANRLARGFGFAFATAIFAGRYLVTEDTRRDYGERRFVAVGRVAGLHLTVIYTDRDTAGDMVRRIISARRSSPKERSQYAQACSQEGGFPPGHC